MIRDSVKALEVMRLLRRIGGAKPKITFEGITYPDLNDIDGWMEVIKDLEDEGYVIKEVYDRIIKCPNCGSLAVRSRYHCPTCNSFNLEKSRIIQHTICGYTSSEREFKKNEKMICPRCGGELTKENVDYVILGWSYECIDCGKRTAYPIIKHKCLSCGYEFTSRESIYEPIHMYRLSEKGLESLETGSLIADVIKSIFEGEGYTVEIGGVVSGTSGLKHKFSVVVKSEKGIVGIDIHSGEELTTPEMVSFITKTYDAGIPHILFCHRAGEDVKESSKTYGAIVIENYDFNRLREVVKEVLG